MFHKWWVRTRVRLTMMEWWWCAYYSREGRKLVIVTKAKEVFYFAHLAFSLTASNHCMLTAGSVFKVWDFACEIIEWFAIHLLSTVCLRIKLETCTLFIIIFTHICICTTIKNILKRGLLLLLIPLNNVTTTIFFKSTESNK